MLEVCTVSYSLGGQPLLDRVSFSLACGEVLVLIGPNGAGKTTLLKLVAGDLPLTTGMILLHGLPLPQVSTQEQARLRAVLRQQSHVSLPFRTFDVVLMGRHPHLAHDRETALDCTIARQAMLRTDTLALEQRTFPTLSGGEQTRALLAKTLAQEAPLLLLDEPTAALDLGHQHATLRLAREVASTGGAVLAVLHDLTLAATYADRIGVLRDGHLVALGTPWEVLRADLLEQVYGVPVLVQRHPIFDTPLVLVTPHEHALSHTLKEVS